VKEYKYIRKDAGEFVKLLNQWRHKYLVEIIKIQFEQEPIAGKLVSAIVARTEMVQDEPDAFIRGYGQGCYDTEKQLMPYGYRM